MQINTAQSQRKEKLESEQIKRVFNGLQVWRGSSGQSSRVRSQVQCGTSDSTD